MILFSKIIIHRCFQKNANTFSKKKKIGRYINNGLKISCDESDESDEKVFDKETDKE